MAIVTLPTTFADGIIPTAAQFNGNFNAIINEFNGDITNANVAASAGIVESKLTFSTTTGHRHTGSDSRYLKTPEARVYNSANLSIPNTAVTTLTFDSEQFDSDTIHDTSSNTSRLTCNTPGVYQITGQIAYTSNATGIRSAYIRLNGTNYIAITTTNAVNGDRSIIQVTTQYELIATDYVELQTLQSSGGALNAEVQNAYSPYFSMVRIGPPSASA